MTSDQWRTYLVTQQSLSEGRSTEEIVEAAIDGGIDAVQLREKGTSAQDRIELGERLRELTSAADVDLLVNDRIDIAYAIGADGVHLGQSDPSVSTAREILGPEATVGVSVSTVSEARLAAISGADYLGVGAIYGTDSKPDAETADDGLGVDQLARIVEAVKLPVVAIGGITPDNASGPIQAGASAVAVISAITAADDPEAATRELREAVVGKAEVAADD
ncbi:thiamine phosphate synthase [Halonotius terrestris]|uniref:Thiamine-phosphate synthase n=1 Tax=Halonotius terrestris TaxID=2487750 RepID=A0A8J8PE14_9EURY|nr:thiamine phosphate synthase [Halonotius terrestris]TQQ83585.1 thiamine phosphate synthase [Halonotius terrestris]